MASDASSPYMEAYIAGARRALETWPAILTQDALYEEAPNEARSVDYVLAYYAMIERLKAFEVKVYRLQRWPPDGWPED